MMDDDLRRVCGLALQILEDLPDKLRPESNIEDMREIVAGNSSGRDDYIVQEAVALALAWRTRDAIARPLNPEDPDAFAARYNDRRAEFGSLFAALSMFEPNSVAVLYVEACNRIARVSGT
jgi:hypothetical protein